MKTLLHVDMDAFFASVEQSRHPELKGKPVIIGAGPHERGVVSTCSYEARKFGVHSAMPSRTAYAKCPQAIFVRPDMELYQEVSRRAFGVFGRFTPYVEAVSIDEAFLDITGSIHLFGDARTLGERLRAEVFAECGVTCSVGIAPNRLLAKIGSEENKPNRLTMMPFEPEAIAAFLAPKLVGVLWGVGKNTVEALKAYGIVTCGDLQRLGGKIAPELVDYAFGRCEDTVYWQESEEKSVSREYTFPEDVRDRAVIRAKLLELVEDVGRRFRSERRWATTVRIKLRNSAFETYTRQMTLSAPSRDDITFRKAALELFDREPSFPVRLIGFGVTNFRMTPEADDQLSLFGDPQEESRRHQERLSEAIDSLRDRGFSV